MPPSVVHATPVINQLCANSSISDQTMEYTRHQTLLTSVPGEKDSHQNVPRTTCKFHFNLAVISLFFQGSTSAMLIFTLVLRAEAFFILK